MTDLQDLLDRATDRVEAPGGAAAAIAEARRRRTWQRGIVAGAVAAAAVVAVVVSVESIGGDQAAREVPPASQAPSPSVPHPGWDPRVVDDLPAAPRGAAPLLPAVLEVPDLAPHVEDAPIDAAVLSVDDGADVLLLGTDGRWHCVVVPGRTGVDPVLSPDGTHLTVEVDDGIVDVDLTTGAQTRISRAPVNPDLGWVGPAVVTAARGWTVRPVAELGDGSSLLRVEPPRGSSRSGWWLVRWDEESDTFSLVTAVDSDPRKAASFAGDLLAGR